MRFKTFKLWSGSRIVAHGRPLHWPFGIPLSTFSLWPEMGHESVFGEASGGEINLGVSSPFKLSQ